jgi:hypothetical protein
MKKIIKEDLKENAGCGITISVIILSIGLSAFVNWVIVPIIEAIKSCPC